MTRHSSLISMRAALLAGAVGLTLAATAAKAQDDGRYREVVYGPGDTETVIVHAPYGHLHRYADGTTTLSREVSVADLDLTTRDGRHELRLRVRDTARDLCEKLRIRATNTADPLDQMDMPRCEHDAYRDAMTQVHNALADARETDDDRR